VHDPQVGGGRIIGEACHFIDLISFLTSSEVDKVFMSGLGINPDIRTDNASLILEYKNGSQGIINYFSNGSKAYSKERIEVYSQGRTLILDNFRELQGYGFSRFKKLKGKQDKGHQAQFERLIKAMKKGSEALIDFNSILNTTKASFAAIESLQKGCWVTVE
jgi:predicted dehydrogenase